MTTVSISTADLRRPVSPTMFADLLPDEDPDFGGEGGMQDVTFAADLDAATVAAVRDRLLTCDATQEAARADLRAKRDALLADPNLANVTALALATADYVLGD